MRPQASPPANSESSQPQSPQSNSDTLKKTFLTNNKSFLFILLGLTFFLLATSAITIRKSQTEPPIPQTLKPNLEDTKYCTQNSDCTIGIQFNTCCPCPEAVNKNVIGKNDWQEYGQNKTYTPTIECDVLCEQCRTPETTICQNNKCMWQSDDTSQTTSTWKTHSQTYKNINFEISYPSSWHLDLRDRASYFEDGISILITEKKPYPVENTLHIQALKLTAPYYMPENSTDEEIIQGYVNWDSSNLLRPLENYPVKSFTKTKITIKEKEAIKYTYTLEKPNIKGEYKIDWIFVPLRPNMIIILSHGEDKHMLDQILSTFKFLGNIELTCQDIPTNLPELSFSQAFCGGYGCNNKTNKADCESTDIVKVENNDFVSGKDGITDCIWVESKTQGELGCTIRHY